MAQTEIRPSTLTEHDRRCVDKLRTELVRDGRALSGEDLETLCGFVASLGGVEAASELGIHRGALVRALAQVVPVSRLSVSQIRHVLEASHAGRANRTDPTPSETDKPSSGQASGGDDRSPRLPRARGATRRARSR